MHSQSKLLMATAAICTLMGSYALAGQPGDRNGDLPGIGNSYGRTGGSYGSKGAPGPIAGAGLPFLLLAGGYALMRRYRRRAQRS